ncbi:MAG: hypothetical protein FWB74_03505 [Defluviitaleaceae bacterium]|nr:hypothetical protein [Defluviitaleaceae bacterium]
MVVRGVDEFLRIVANRLEMLPHKHRVHFAWMCAVRALPLLSKSRGFEYWGIDKQEHLLAILFSLDVACVSVRVMRATRVAINATRATRDAVCAVDISYAINAAANVARAAETSYNAADASYVADAIYAATRATINIEEFQNILISDLYIISNNKDASNHSNDINIYMDIFGRIFLTICTILAVDIGLIGMKNYLETNSCLPLKDLKKWKFALMLPAQ